MSRPVRFRVSNLLPAQTGQILQVFLTQVEAVNGHPFHYTPWRTLRPPAGGGSVSFELRGTLTLAVEDAWTGNRSRQVSTSPNQLYAAELATPQGPTLRLESESPPSSRQVVVRNRTDPATLLRAVWSIDGRPVMAQEGLNLAAAATFALAPRVHFRLAYPRAGRPTFSLGQATEGWTYPLSHTTEDVEVAWQRSAGLAGRDVLSFHPAGGQRLSGAGAGPKNAWIDAR